MQTDHVLAHRAGSERLELGIRPEFISFAATGIPVQISKVSDVDRYRIVETRHGDHDIKLLVQEGEELPRANIYLHFDPTHTHVYFEQVLNSERFLSSLGRQPPPGTESLVWTRRAGIGCSLPCWVGLLLTWPGWA